MIYQQIKRGFSLIETFVAITILIVAVIGPLSLFAKAISDGIFARNQVTAFFLAQEGLELALAQRNHEGKWWDATDCESGCTIDWSDSGEIVLNSAGNGTLFYDSDNAIYSHTSGSATIYSRLIYTEIQDVDASWNPNAGVKVTSTVTWDYKGLSRQTSLSSLMFKN